MSDKKNIQEKHLDDMLKEVFLHKKFQDLNEDSASFIFQQEYDVKMDTVKERRLIDKLNGKQKGSGNYLNYWVILVAAIGGLILFFYKNEVFHSNPIKKNVQIKNIHKQDSISHNAASKVSLPIERKGAEKVDNFKSIVKHTPSDNRFNLNDVAIYFPHSGVGSKSDATFFKPTIKEMAFYKNVKYSMIERVINLDRETYTSLEEDKINYRGKWVIVNSFCLKNQTISNLEYKAFLADLIKNNRQEEFKRAIVRNEVWINYNDNILASTYFFDDRYNDFPVVNISPEAATLFCEWLETEINQYSQHIGGKAKEFKIRLPLDAEWILATVKGVNKLPDCEGYSPVYDLKDGLLSPDDKKRMALAKTTLGSKETEPFTAFSVNRYTMNEDQMLQLFDKELAYLSAEVTDTLDPSKMKLVNKTGHISEIIRQLGTDNTMLIGTCWKNKKQYNNMLKEFKEAAASPFIGFRIVLIENEKERALH